MKPEDVLCQYKNLFFQGFEVLGEEEKRIAVKFNRDRVLVVLGQKLEVFKDMNLIECEARLREVKFSRSRDEKRMGIRLEFGKGDHRTALDVVGENLTLTGSIDE